MATRDRAPTALPIATAITLLAALLRFLYLGHDSLWFDEVLTRGTAVASLASPAAALAMRDHVPLLYWLTALVLRVLPEHEVTLRLVSALAGVLAVPLLLALGRAARLPAAGRWAALLLAVSPFHIRYSQEARHYALLLFFSLLALYWLYRATAAGACGDRRAGRIWLAFAAATVANLLTHYSAWLWLVGQGVAVALWLAWRARQGDRRAARPVLPAMFVIGVALVLLLGRAAEALRANTDGAAGTTSAAALSVWLRALWLEFGFFRPLPAAALALLAVGGAVALRRRPWLAALLAVCAVVPVGLIQGLAITRFALPKYVIYLLPLYLFAAGAGIDAVLALVRRPRTRTAMSAVTVAAILLVAAPAVATEYRQMVHDWRGAAAQLGPAAPGDVVLTIALDTGDGFNAAGVVAPIYLDPGFRLLDGNHLTAGDLAALAGARGRVSALALNLYAPVVVDPGDGWIVSRGWIVSHHVSSLFALRRVDTADVLGDDVLDQLAALYAQLIPQAIPPAQCALWPILAQTQLARGDTGAASAALAARSPD
ncbi:MAG: glycosyltransferase family 39 protein, partial [Anaerolineae bacterium]|nr:glycosyltransferase family 39 protein [Anaerolineae bacterium]